jgi:hypothetical protein
MDQLPGDTSAQGWGESDAAAQPSCLAFMFCFILLHMKNISF